MPRQARAKSNSGVYHLMLRGINGQDIFLDREDRQKFIKTLKKYKEKCGYQVYGYCLMNNHIHLVLKEGEEELSLVMKRIGVSYVAWYNFKYERTGHLFQDRFKSEEIEDDQYLLVALRYIHQNPLNAGMVKSISDYEWSSFNDYFSQKKDLTDYNFVLRIFDSDREKAVKSFNLFMRQAAKDKCLDYDDISKKRMYDQDVVRAIQDLTGLCEPELLLTYEKKARDSVLLELRENGATIRQLVALTGLGRGVIERVTRNHR